MMIDSMSVEMVCPEAHPSPLLLPISTAISICLFSLVFCKDVVTRREPGEARGSCYGNPE